MRTGERPGPGGLVARLFCLVPSQPLDGASSPKRLRRASSPRARAPDCAPGEEQTGGGGASDPAHASPPAGAPRLTPTSSAALAAYLGSASLEPPSTPSHCDADAAPSGWTSFTDSAASRGSSGTVTCSAACASGSGSGGASPRCGGYEADSDDPASDIYSPRRFRPAVRRLDSSSAVSAAAGEEEAHAGCGDADAPHSPAASYSSATPCQRHSRSSSSQSLSALSGASSLSFAHFLRGRSFGARSGTRRAPGGAQQEPPTPADSLAPGLPTVVAPAAEPGGGAAGSAADGGAVQRTLSATLAGHYISLEKLHKQCGNIEEPPSDLLSLMARRVLSSRSALLHRLQEESAAPAAAAAARPASPDAPPAPQASPATTPRSPPAAAPAQAEAEAEPGSPASAAVQRAAAPPPLQEQVQAQLQRLPVAVQLPRIKTKVGQRRAPSLRPAA